MNVLTLEKDLMRLEVGQPATVATSSGPRMRRLIAVAEETGAAVGPAVAGLIAAEHDRDDLRRAVKVATAQARAVAGLLVATPFVLVPGLSSLTGMDAVAFYASGAGRPIGLAGVGLVGAGLVTIVLMIMRVGRVDGSGRRSTSVDADEVAELVATALSSGMPLPLALRAVGEVAGAHGRALVATAMAIELDLGDPSDDDHDPLTVLVLEGWRLGAPLVPVLRRHATSQRADQRARVLARIERLPVLLAVPTALCLLPGTVLLVGAPIVHVGLRSVVGAT